MTAISHAGLCRLSRSVRSPALLPSSLVVEAAACSRYRRQSVYGWTDSATHFDHFTSSDFRLSLGCGKPPFAMRGRHI